MATLMTIWKTLTRDANRTSPHIHLTFSDCSITKKRLIDPDFNAALECLLEAHAATTYQI